MSSGRVGLVAPAASTWQSGSYRSCGGEALVRNAPPLPTHPPLICKVRDFPIDFYQRDGDDAAGVMEALGHEKFNVVGWSGV